MNILSIMFAAGDIGSTISLVLGGLFFIFCAVMNTFGIRAYGLDWREWKHNYRLSRPMSMVTRAGIVLIGLAIYNSVTGR